jgi:hypothetical protein
MTGNCVYLVTIIIIKSKLQSKATKMKLYKTLIRSLVCYGAVTWTLSKSDANRLHIYKRKVVQNNNIIKYIL